MAITENMILRSFAAAHQCMVAVETGTCLDEGRCSGTHGCGVAGVGHGK
jgi:hypothetical protein